MHGKDLTPVLTARIVPAEQQSATNGQLLLVFGAAADVVAFAWLMSVGLELPAASVLGAGCAVGLALAIREYRRMCAAELAEMDRALPERAWTAEAVAELRPDAPVAALKPSPRPRASREPWDADYERHAAELARAVGEVADDLRAGFDETVRTEAVLAEIYRTRGGPA